MEIKEYPTAWVKRAVDHVYGSVISDRTWRKWLRICKVKSWTRVIEKEQVIYLLTLAYLKKYHSRKSLGFVHIKQHLKSSTKPESFLYEQLDEVFYSQVTGKDLPHVIRQVTGKLVTIRTLYRWADKHNLVFGLSKKIPMFEVQKWVDLVG